jgi:hypothetical protein
MGTIELTKEELQTTIATAVYSAQELKSSKKSKVIHGIQGLADLLRCTRVTAQRYKAKGLIPYSQIGRKIFFDEDEVINALKKEVLHG